MQLSHRRYVAGDRQLCADIFRSNVPHFFRDHEYSDFMNFLDESGCPFFVVLNHNEVVACGGFGIRDKSDTADLCWGMVSRKRHHEGIGAYLLFARLFSIIESAAAKNIRLGTSQHTEGFFRHYGFEIQLVRPDGIDAGLDDVEMSLNLSDVNLLSIKRHWQRLAE